MGERSDRPENPAQNPAQKIHKEKCMLLFFLEAQ